MWLENSGDMAWRLRISRCFYPSTEIGQFRVVVLRLAWIPSCTRRHFTPSVHAPVRPRVVAYVSSTVCQVTSSDPSWHTASSAPSPITCHDGSRVVSDSHTTSRHGVLLQHNVHIAPVNWVPEQCPVSAGAGVPASTRIRLKCALGHVSPRECVTDVISDIRAQYDYLSDFSR